MGRIRGARGIQWKTCSTLYIWGLIQLFTSQWPDGRLPDNTDELDSGVFRKPWFVEGHAFHHVSMRVISIDPPSRRHPERRPTIHCEGDIVGGGSNEVRVRGTVHDEGGDVIRWSVG